MTLRVVEILGRADGGITRPYRCRLSDDQIYYLKGREATPRGLVAEALCAAIGTAFGLPIPVSRFATVDKAILQFDREAEGALGSGIAFASKKVNGLTPVTFATVDRIDARLQQKIYVFDCWVRNEDRTGTENGGNSNLFLASPNNVPVVLDHNLAFDKNFDISNNINLHICRNSWLVQRDLTAPSEFSGQMAQLMKIARDVCDAIPLQWLSDYPEVVDEFLDILQQGMTAQFWEEING
jgi:hypothetical protein